MHPTEWTKISFGLLFSDVFVFNMHLPDEDNELVEMFPLRQFQIHIEFQMLVYQQYRNGNQKGQMNMYNLTTMYLHIWHTRNISKIVNL